MIFVGPVAQALGLPAGAKSKLTGDGSALGANASVAWKMTENQRLAATVRSPFSIEYAGRNRIEYAGSLAIEGEIDYPTIVALAYGIELTDTLRVEADVEWLEFSNYQTLVIKDQFGGNNVTPQNLEDTWTAGIGAEWDFAPQWTLRSGFMHLENPTPDETYSPLSPDEDQQVVSLGLGYETEHHVVDVAYAYGIFGGRDISGSVNSPDGQYDFDLQVVSLSYGYKF
jgi:long-chain fatty acid transport protein